MNKKVTERVYEMFQQVHKCITQMLKSLQYIYQANGIKYNIDDKFDFLLRILTPFELLTYLDITNIQEILDSHSDVFWAVRSKPKSKEEHNFKMNYPKTCISSSTGRMKKGVVKTNPIKNNLIGSNQKQAQDSFSISSYLINSKKVQNEAIRNAGQISELSEEEERKICLWIIKQSSLRRKLTKEEVMNQVKLISCREDFPVVQWFRIFLFRHPQLSHCFNRSQKEKEPLQSDQPQNKDYEGEESRYPNESGFSNKQKVEMLKKKILKRNKKTSIFQESQSDENSKNRKNSKINCEDYS